MAAPTRKGYAYTSPGVAGTTISVSPDGTIATGDWVVMVLASLNTTTVTNPSGWTVLQSFTTAGTMGTAIWGKIRGAGDSSYSVILSANGTASSLTLMWGANATAVSSWTIGANMLRASITPTTTFNNVAPSITTTVNHSLILAISTERTTTTESDISSISGASEWFFGPQFSTTQLQTTTVGYIADKATAGATGDVTIVYPNTQANNGMAMQLGITAASPGNPPTAAFTLATAGLTVAVNGSTSSDSDGTISSYAWTYGDGATAATATASHNYAAAGSYTVALTVTDNDGLTGSVSHTAVIDAAGQSVSVWNGTYETPATLKYWNGTTELTPASYASGASPVTVSGLASPILAAHRGGSANWPEMTLRAYKESAEVWGMQAIEISVQMSSDGTFWCSHDATTTRMTGVADTIASTTDAALAVLTCTASATDNTAQPREPLARLSDVLALYGGKRVIFIEDKTYAHQTALLDIMDANGGTSYYIWKQDGTGTKFAASASRGYKSWGYFFDSGMAGSFASKQAQWDYVGLDYNSSDATLTSAVATAGASRCIGHIIPSTAQRDRMLGFGMAGLMIANVRDCLPKIV